MMSQVVPSDADIAGALALIRAALDPKSAKAVLDKIAAEKAALSEARADIDERVRKHNEAKAEFYRERDAYNASVRDFSAKADALEQARSAHAGVVQAFERASQQHAADKAQQDAAHRQREQALAKRERDADEVRRTAARMIEENQKLAADLDKRNAAVQQAEADLREKRAQLAAVLA